LGVAGVLASAERYSWASNSFVPVTPSPTAARAQHTQTIFDNGSILLAGGIDAAYQPQKSTEVYSPDLGTITPTGDMLEARSFHTAVAPSAQAFTVIVAGGVGTGNVALPTAEIFSAVTSSFQGAGSMAAARYWHSAAPVTIGGNAGFLVAGGTSDGSTML